MKNLAFRSLWTLLFFLSILPLRAEEPAAAEKLIQDWTQEQNKSQSPVLRKFFAGKPEFKSDHVIEVKPAMVKVLPEKLRNRGVAMEYSIRDLPPEKLSSAKTFTLNGRGLLIAEYGKGGEFGSIFELYLKNPSGYERVFHIDGCCFINIIQLGRKGPLLVSNYQSGCGSGGGGSLYSVGTDGVKEVFTWGGWRAGISFSDVDGNGIDEVFDGSASSSYPEELEKKLKKIKGYENDGMSGPKWWDGTVSQWDGKTFHVIGQTRGEYEN